ncbi:hypothetical protein ACROYT_G016491 [Oculina patagonica]
MGTTTRAPKQWSLSKNETINSFENWRQNLVYTLPLDTNFAPFLADGATWAKKTRAQPLRGFTDDGETVPLSRRKTARQKVNFLELMLGQIANYCPVISRSTLLKNSTSIQSVWNMIREHFGVQITGAHFLDFANLYLEADERPEDLFQRLMAFVEDTLLHANSLSHHGDVTTEDEELTPTLENFIVLTWLRLIHPELPKLVKQRYGTELRSRTLASIKPEISQALTSLLDEIRTANDAKIMRTAVSSYRKPSGNRSQYKVSTRPSRPSKSCPLCKQANRPESGHFLSECSFLPEQDRRYIAKARQIADIFDDPADPDTRPYADEPDSDTDDPGPSPNTHVFRIQTRQSPYLDMFHAHHPVRITIDSGATGNMIRHTVVQRLGCRVTPSSQSVHQADGSSPLHVVGETRLSFTRGDRTFTFEGLVVEDLDVDVLAGTPFMETNDIAVRPAKRQVILGDGSIHHYGSHQPAVVSSAARRAIVLRSPSSSTTIWPGEFIEVDLPSDAPRDSVYALEPRTDAPSARKLTASQLWPSPAIISSVAGKIRIPNLSPEPHFLKRNEHFCQVRAVYAPEARDDNAQLQATPQPRPPILQTSTKLSSNVCLDPENLLPRDIRAKFTSLLDEYDHVFDPNIKGYNGSAGPFEARVNMGPVEPPQRKGRLPQYARHQLLELQQKFDELETLGVFRRPEDINVAVEYLNPSFLIKKANGGYRLVTAFADVGRYSKPQPSLMPDVDSTLRLIAQWKHIVATDLTSAFYQIPLSRDSMEYCGVATPFRGVRVYARSAMGMPGSETALEELMSRVLGDLLQEGIVAKIADDLYCGGNSPEELLQNWTKVLQALNKCDLRLSASKTVINPQSTTILGWIWNCGTLSASPHRIAALASCPAPDTVARMRSFIGAFKVFSRVIPGCSTLLAKLDDTVAGRESNETIQWTDDLTASFHNAQTALSNTRTISLPRPVDQLWIVTDGDGKLRVAGFFSAKLRGSQTAWLPCEVEALAIAVATKQFSPYLIQSHHKACILTDSKPCVQAYEKLCRGEFSANPRVSTFLSTVSRYQASVRHVSGSAILPSDFSSRNAAPCEDEACQVCAFAKLTQESVVRHTSTQDILRGTKHLPFTSRTAWLTTQAECPDLRRTRAHLQQGTRPSKKLTNLRDVKRYLNVATIAKDGLLVVKRNEPLAPTRECIIVPRQVLEGLLTALHIQLGHPSSHQLKAVTKRYLYALDIDKAIDRVTQACHQCAALRQTPKMREEQSSSPPPDAVGVSFAADVIKRSRQLILVLRECVTSFTATTLLEDERHNTLRDALIRLCVQMRPLDGPSAVIHTDPASGFKALTEDLLLKHHRITIEIGNAKNRNKNPVAERAVQEVENELLRHDPLGGPVSPVTLSVATATLNARIRSRGLSAREMWTQRDQFSNQQIPLHDQNLIVQQHEQRIANHHHSEKAKAPIAKNRPAEHITVGDLVYLKFVGSQLRSTSYRVKTSDCYRVPSEVADYRPSAFNDDVDSSSDEAPPAQPVRSPPSPPVIPSAISTPATQDFPHDSLPDGGQEPCEDNHPNPVTDSPASDSETSPPPRRSTRVRRPPARYNDFVLDSN